MRFLQTIAGSAAILMSSRNAKMLPRLPSPASGVRCKPDGRSRAGIRRLLAVSLQLTGVLILGACSLVAPKYNASFDNTQMLRDAGLEKVKLGQISAAPNAKGKVDKLSIRGSSYTSPYDKSFVSYLEEALRQELDDGRLLDPSANTSVDGVLIRNELDGMGFSTGTADIEAQFVVRRDGAVRFDKVKSAHHEWGSSFIGAIAIPAAAENYPVVVKKLVSSLFADPDFIAALKK